MVPSSLHSRLANHYSYLHSLRRKVAAAFEHSPTRRSRPTHVQTYDAWPNLFRQSRFCPPGFFKTDSGLRRRVADENGPSFFFPKSLAPRPSLRDEMLTITNFITGASPRHHARRFRRGRPSRSQHRLGPPHPSPPPREISISTTPSPRPPRRNPDRPRYSIEGTSVAPAPP